MPKDFSIRNQEIYDEVNASGRSQGAYTRAAEKHNITRQRVHSIVNAIDAKNGKGGTRSKFTVTMGPWKTDPETAAAFAALCTSKGWSQAFGMREAVKALIIANKETPCCNN